MSTYILYVIIVAKRGQDFLLQLILDRRDWKVRKAFGRLERGPRADHVLVKIERQLTRNIIYDARRNTLQVLQKCAQKTHGAELQSKSQAVVIATANRDEFPIRIIQMEAPRQLLGR